jgi:hypothetical protein
LLFFQFFNFILFLQLNPRAKLELCSQGHAFKYCWCKSKAQTIWAIKVCKLTGMYLIFADLLRRFTATTNILQQPISTNDEDLEGVYGIKMNYVSSPKHVQEIKKSIRVTKKS